MRRYSDFTHYRAPLLPRVLNWPLLRITALLFASALLLAIFGLTSQLGQVSLGAFDKLVHAGVYGAIAVLLFVSLGSHRAALAFFLTSLAGLADELHQAAVPGRTADPMDWVADTLAAAIAILLLRYLVPRLAARL